MAEAATVRLVRCPQCENLLPEPPEISVYQCGGCGAVLRAKKKGLLDDGISGISDDGESGGVSGNGDVNPGLISDFRPERESNGIEPGRVERNLNENGIVNSSSSLATADKGVSANSNRPRRGTEKIDQRIDQNRKIGITDDEYRHTSEVSHDNSVRDSTNCGLNIKRGPAFVNSNNDNSLEKDLFVGSLRSRPAINQKSADRTSSVASLADANGVSGQRRFAKFPYPDEGPSNYGRGSLYNYGNYMTYGDHLDGLARVENLENDRAELLRKLDELADQLSRSCDVAERPRERSFHDRRIPPAPPDSYGRQDVFVQGGSISYGVNKQPLVPDKHVSRPPYFTHSHGYPFMGRHGSAVQDPYSSTNHMQEYRGFADAYQPQMLRRPSHQLPHQYFQESDYEHFPGRYVDFNQDLFMSHPHETFFHQPACSCLHCFNKNWHAPPKVQPPNFSSQNAGNNYMHRIPHPPANPVAYGLQGYISEGSNLQQQHSLDRQPLTRSSSDLGRETGAFGHRHLKKVVVAHGNGQVFHPVAGGAPFITCCNCWELLKLPRKIMSVQKNHRKMKCGACSSILLFEIEGKGIVVSVPVETEPVTRKIAAAANEIPAENYRNSNDFSDTYAVNTSNDYENFNYDFDLGDDELDPSLRDQRSNSGAPDMRLDPHSSSSSSSEDEQSPDNLILKKDVSHVAKDEACLPLPDSPAQEYPDHPSDKVMQRNGRGNKSKHIDQDKNIQDGIISRQNSLKDALVATEMDFSYNDHSSTVVSHESAEVRKDEVQPKTTKGGESIFVVIKRRFGELSRSSKTTESGRSIVSVNGHFLSDRVVKKAEKLAGPIQPGDYWYDFRAGFWGVMGHPCLGILPPNIDEFDYPLPQDCSRGNSGVFVNGRELHQKDLDLLAGRGLPTTRHKSYLVEISGRVVDEHTGEELDSLGKLAPTVERAKHGFGMKVPKSLRQQL